MDLDGFYKTQPLTVVILFWYIWIIDHASSTLELRDEMPEHWAFNERLSVCVGLRVVYFTLLQCVLPKQSVWRVNAGRLRMSSSDVQIRVNYFHSLSAAWKPVLIMTLSVSDEETCFSSQLSFGAVCVYFSVVFEVCFRAQCNSRGRDIIKGNHCPPRIHHSVDIWSGFALRTVHFINDRMLSQAVFWNWRWFTEKYINKAGVFLQKRIYIDFFRYI